MGAKFILLLFVVFFMAGCMSLSNFQTAQVLEEGQSQFVAALTATSVSAGTNEMFFEDVTYVMPEFMLRHAPAKDFELGAKFWFSFPIAGFVFDAKYQFVNGEAFDMALDLGLGYNEIDVDTGAGDEKTKIIDVYPSLLLTYAASESSSVTLAPRLFIRKLKQDVSGTDTQTTPGVTLTLAMGKKVKIMPEIGFYKGENSDFSHYGIGLGFPF